MVSGIHVAKYTMISLFQAVLLLNALFFLFYGIQCLASQTMVSEFERFRLHDSQRVLTGVLQLFASAGLAAGLIFPAIGALASGGLALMMLVAFLVRIRVGDGVIQSAPSLFFLVLNAWLSVSFVAMMQAAPAITEAL